MLGLSLFDSPVLVFTWILEFWRVLGAAQSNHVLVVAGLWSQHRERWKARCRSSLICETHRVPAQLYEQARPADLGSSSSATASTSSPIMPPPAFIGSIRHAVEVTGLKSPRGDSLDLLERQVAYTLHAMGQPTNPMAVLNYTMKLIREGGDLLPWRKKVPMPEYRQLR
jgi:hypothetical protein